MAAKPLTVAAVQRLTAKDKRLEVRDAGAPGLHLVIQTSGVKSWAVRLRRPNGKSAKLTLGKFAGGDDSDEPVLGGALTLRQARELANRIDRERAAGQDVATTVRRRAAEGDDFAALARDFVSDHCMRHNRGWRATAKVLGLDYSDRDSAPTLVAGGLAERWANVRAADPTRARCSPSWTRRGAIRSPAGRRPGGAE